MQAQPSPQPVAPTFRLAVLEAVRPQQLHAARASELHGRATLFRARAASGDFEALVEQAPGTAAEGRGGAGEGVQGAADKAHLCDGDGAEVGGYFGDHLRWEGGESWGGLLCHSGDVFLS